MTSYSTEQSSPIKSADQLPLLASWLRQGLAIYLLLSQSGRREGEDKTGVKDQEMQALMHKINNQLGCTAQKSIAI